MKIADFGIARAYNALSQRLTVTGKAMGTPAYMSPEQALNEPIGPSTDLYALGVIVYELLAGRPPFDADTPVGVLYCHVHKPPPPLKGARARDAARRLRVGPLAAGQGATRPPALGAPGVGRAGGDRGRGARAVLAPGRGDHGARPGPRGGSADDSLTTTEDSVRGAASRRRRSPSPGRWPAARAGGSACSPPRSARPARSRPRSSCRVPTSRARSGRRRRPRRGSPPPTTSTATAASSS